MSMMDVTGPHFCPDCPPVKNRHGKRIGAYLECSDGNYSGTGVDMANCQTCGHGFSISFKVDKVERAEDWDVDIESEEEAEKQMRDEHIKSLEDQLKKLRGEAK